ncbi:F-box domain protein [Aspergillus ruber CBS 135680]|uniref:F-box domain-containing protein n=1 Tax=Aspergillus ruber (strain CBS 135680) TaxID=1388766 RepID=A0A017S3W2_ASPRC|nr:uncharacterized protein EURHEDRAFT_416298 [Aspergillus ruber CBS 135680]EYE91622.1 hypothetical protein EURHEDRAFT_416298 [Aspergillus ruber CBS 135680]
MTDLTRSLDSIPYDVFYQIASKLDCHDFISLSRVNRSLNHAMSSEPIARKTIENNLLHTKEGQDARRSKSGYRKAVGRLFDIKESFATAQPYSASVIAYGTTFLYDSGSLCYVHDDDIRVLNVHGAAQKEQVMNISNVVARLLPHHAPGTSPIRLSLLHYSDGILAFLVELAEGPEAWLFAIDLRQRPANARNGRLRLRTQLSSTRRLFVRHNGSYLYYGTHSSLGYDGYPLWAIHCVNLKTGRHMSEKPVELAHFAGNEIGQTVCFGLHQNHLYAVSTQVDCEEEEVDWTSFYIWVCLAPEPNTRRQVTPNRTWRRQHREGPINDTWTDLSLRHDEATKRLMILECRREWRNGGSENCRTYYMQALPSPNEINTGKQHTGPTDARVPHHEPLIKVHDPSSKPNPEPPKKRLRRHYHPEYQLRDTGTDDSTQRRDFILAKTKYHAYNLSASSFIDLVNDPSPNPTNGSTSLIPHDRLRLRTVSRKRKCPIDESGEEGPCGLLYRPDLNNTTNQPIDHSEERFVSRGVHIWPPDNAPTELNNLLCPSERSGRVQAMADERSIVYSVNHDGLTDGKQAFILINFDPSIKFPGLTKLYQYNDHLDEMFSSAQDPAGVAVGVEQPQFGGPSRERHSMSVVRTTGTNVGLPSVREEAAIYLRINRGFWLR